MPDPHSRDYPAPPPIGRFGGPPARDTSDARVSDPGADIRFPLRTEAPASDPMVPLLPIGDGQAESFTRWSSRRDAIVGTTDPRAFGARAVDLPLSTDDEPSTNSQAAMDAIAAGIASPRCSEIHGCGPDQLFAKFEGTFHRIDVRFDDEASYNSWVKEQVDTAEAVISWNDITERRRGIFQRADGSSMTVVLPPFAPFQAFSIRKQTVGDWTLEQLVAGGSMSNQMVSYLRAVVAARGNILIVGEMGAGKTSMINMLSHEFAPNERIAVIEEIPEIQIAQPQVVYLTYQPMQATLGLKEVLDSSLYMRFDRVIVGEVHLEGITKMLEVWMTGSDGSFSTYHSDSCERAVERMKLALQLENPNMTAETALGLIRQAVDVVVVLDRVGGLHRCTEIVEIDWRESGGPGKVGQNRIFALDRKADRHLAAGKPDEKGKVMVKAAKYGIPFSADWFAAPLGEGFGALPRY